VELVIMPGIICCGEGMIELRQGDDTCQLAYGGDTLNTAIHMSRAGLDVAYLTALGSDPFSAGMRREWEGEGLDTSLIVTHPSRHPGLYAITTDQHGERSFTYWRESSAAKDLFTLAGSAQACARAAHAELFIFSLISLAILPDDGRDALLALVRQVRENGGKVAFDGNYRPRLWTDPQEAMHWRDRAIAVADIGLPTLDDEIMLSGHAHDADTAAAHWSELGCGEVIVKMGALGCRLADGRILPPASLLAPVDTSGAGDAFNAGYLAARMGGGDAEDAACAGQALAAWTIMRPGAIPRRDS